MIFVFSLICAHGIALHITAIDILILIRRLHTLLELKGKASIAFALILDQNAIIVHGCRNGTGELLVRILIYCLRSQQMGPV